MPKWAKILIGVLAVGIIIIIALVIYISVAFIGEDGVMNSLTDYVQAEDGQITIDSMELKITKNQYEVDFFFNKNEYEAVLNAKTGEVLSTDYPDMTLEQFYENAQNENVTTSDLPALKTVEEAQQIALEHAGLNEADVTLVKAQEETDDGRSYYDIEYRDATFEYDFEILKTGEVYNYSKEPIND